MHSPWTVFDGDVWEEDHVIPKSQGGKDTKENRQLSIGTVTIIKLRLWQEIWLQ